MLRSGASRTALEFDAERASRRVELLASQPMAGRYPGTPGELAAAEELVSVLKRAGCEPWPAANYRREFPVQVCDLLAAPALEAWLPSGLAVFEHLRDFAVDVQGAAGAGEAIGETVWLGALDQDAPGQAGRIGVVQGPSTLPGYLRQLQAARDGGLAGLLRVDDSHQRRKVMMHLKQEPSIPSLAIANEVATALLGPDRKHGARGPRVRLSSPLAVGEVCSAGNVAGALGSGAVGLVIVAHYDHLGMLPDGRFFPGAIDNASGVAVALGVAEALAGTAPELPCKVVFAFTTAEETGMQGAQRLLAEAGPMLTHAIVVCVDELAAVGGAPLVVQATGEWPRLVADDAGEVGVTIRNAALALPGYGDWAAFLEHGCEKVGVLYCAHGQRRRIHTLQDTADGIGAQDLAPCGRGLLLLVSRVTRAQGRP